MPWPWSLLCVPFLIGLNAFFVVAEYAVVAIRPTQIEGLRQRHRAAAADAIDKLKSKTASSIATIQVCITMTNLLLGWLGEPVMTQALERLLGPLAEAIPPAVFEPISTVLAFIVVTLLTVVFSELLPKALTLRFVEPAAVMTARPIVLIQSALWPLVALMNGIANLVTVPLRLGKVDQMDEARVSAEELRLLTTEAANDGVLTSRERSLILNALSLSDRTAKQIMVPRIGVVYLDLKQSMDDNRAIMGQRLFSRLPLCDAKIDNVIGIVHTKEFLSAYNAAGDTSVLQLIAREPVFIPESLPVDKILSTFREKKTQMVVVLDEYGGLAGIVTLRDVVDDLLGAVDQSVVMTTQAMRGEVEAPDRVGEAGLAGDIEQKRATLRVPGDTPLHEIGQRFERRDWAKHEAVATVSGLLQSRLGHIPEPGEFVEVEGVRLRVIDSDARTAKTVEVTILPPPSEGNA